MLEKLIPQLTKELELEDGALGSGRTGTYVLPIGKAIRVIMTNFPNGFMLKSSVAPLPKVKEEEFITEAMLGNLFGQGTKGAILGLSGDDSTLTLTELVDYSTDYNEFKIILEGFINAVEFWQEKALNYK